MRMMLVVDGRWKGKWRWCNPRPSHAPRCLPGLPTLARKPTCHAWESRAHVVSQSSSSSECSPSSCFCVRPCDGSERDDDGLSSSRTFAGQPWPERALRLLTMHISRHSHGPSGGQAIGLLPGGTGVAEVSECMALISEGVNRVTRCDVQTLPPDQDRYARTQRPDAGSDAVIDKSLTCVTCLTRTTNCQQAGDSSQEDTTRSGPSCIQDICRVRGGIGTNICGVRSPSGVRFPLSLPAG